MTESSRAPAERHAGPVGGVAADPALPGAEALLGVEAIEILRPAVAGAGGRLLELRPTQVRYEAGRRMAVRYAAAVEWADGTQRRETLGALVQLDDLPEGVAVVRGDDAEVGVWRYPHDPFLPGLPHAAYPDGAREILAHLGVLVDEVVVEPLVYRPSSRAVLRVTAGQVRLYVKVLRPHATARLVDLHALVGAHVRVPVCLGASEALGIVALEPIAGVPLTRPLVEGGVLPPAGALVGLMEGLREVELPPGTPAAGDALESHARLLRTALPEAAAEVDELAGLALELGDPPVQPVHGDFYEAQVMVGPDGVVRGLLDIDGVRRGAPHDDPSTLLAHLAGLAHVHPSARERIEGYLAEVTAALPAAVDPEALHRGALGHLLGLATTSFRRQEEDWPRRTRQWLDRCAAWAAAGPAPAPRR